MAASPKNKLIMFDMTCEQNLEQRREGYTKNTDNRIRGGRKETEVAQREATLDL